MSENEKAMDRLKAMANKIEVMEWIAEGIDGNAYRIRESIPYEKLREAALERAGMIFCEDEEDGVAFRTFHEELINCYIFCKYYTDIPTDGLLEEQENGVAALFDYVRRNKLADSPYWLWKHKDWAYLVEMSEGAIRTMKDIFDRKHSVLTRLEKLVASLPDNQEEWAKELANSKEVNDQMIDLLSLKTEQTKKDNVMNLIELAKTDK